VCGFPAARFTARDSRDPLINKVVHETATFFAATGVHLVGATAPSPRTKPPPFAAVRARPLPVVT